MIWQIARGARQFLQRWGRPSVVYNVNHDDETDGKKRALFIYMVLPFQLKKSSKYFLYHQNLKQSIQIARIIGSSGYIVDVADVSDTTIQTPYDYDLIISHKIDFDVSTIHHKDSSKYIYLSSGLNHKAYNRNLKKRLEAFTARRNCVLPIEWQTENMRFLTSADAIVGFGNEQTLGSWRESFQGPLYTFNNYAFQGNHSIKINHSTAKRKFLFFSGRRQLVKGLDLLLEVFSRQKDLELYICGPILEEKEFCDCYHHELFETPNIHLLGWVHIHTAMYEKVIQQCTYIIQPSCSEGQIGSVIQCMRDGIIPIVTKECGIDMEHFGITLPSDRIEDIEETVVKLSTMSDVWCQEHQTATKEVSLKKYSEEAFQKRWQEILSTIGI
jgi:glycosyltransferase involved in cell wall biosynthesis